MSIDSWTDEAEVIREKGTAKDADLVAAVHRIGYGASVLPIFGTTLAIEDIGCEGCPQQVRSTLQGLQGVRKVTLRTAEAPRVGVVYDRRRVSRPDMLRALQRAGFSAAVVR